MQSNTVRKQRWKCVDRGVDHLAICFWKFATSRPSIERSITECRWLHQGSLPRRQSGGWSEPTIIHHAEQCRTRCHQSLESGRSESILDCRRFYSRTSVLFSGHRQSLSSRRLCVETLRECIPRSFPAFVRPSLFRRQGSATGEIDNLKLSQLGPFLASSLRASDLRRISTDALMNKIQLFKSVCFQPGKAEAQALGARLNDALSEVDDNVKMLYLDLIGELAAYLPAETTVSKVWRTDCTREKQFVEWSRRLLMLRL